MSAPAPRRRTLQRAEARRAILDATESLLVEDGEGFSIRRLVERCGYTAPTIYHHFGDKDGLFDALLEQRFEKLWRLLRRVPAEPDPLVYVRNMARAFVRFGIRNPTHYQLLSAPRSPDQEPPRSAERAREALDRSWMQLYEQGRLRVDVESASQALWALAHGLISLRITRPEHDWSKNLLHDSIDALLSGLVAPAAAKRPASGRPKGPSA